MKHKKEKSDAAKAKIFTKIGKEMAVAIKAGGPDPNNNSKLRDLIQKAKANNVPNDNIERCIKKALGGGGENYEEPYKDRTKQEFHYCTKKQLCCHLASPLWG